MTTPLVPSITDDQLADLEKQCEKFAGFAVSSTLVEQLISRLRAAERDAERLNKLDAIGYGYGFEDMHEGNAWLIAGPFPDIRAAIDAMQEHNQ